MHKTNIKLLLLNNVYSAPISINITRCDLNVTSLSVRQYKPVSECYYYDYQQIFNRIQQMWDESIKKLFENIFKTNQRLGRRLMTIFTKLISMEIN